MQRFTISLESTLAAEFDRFIVRRAYSSRSEAVRDLIHARLCESGTPLPGGGNSGTCVATLSYTCDGADALLQARLRELRQIHQGTILSSIHIALEDRRHLETIFLRGRVCDVEAFCNLLAGAPGIRDASVKFVMLPAPGAVIGFAEQSAVVEGTIRQHRVGDALDPIVFRRGA